MPFTVSGVTRDRSTGDPLGFCDVYLNKYTDGVPSLIDQGQSDANGAYELIATDDNSAYEVVAHKDGSPAVAGVTGRTLVPVFTGFSSQLIFDRAASDGWTAAWVANATDLRTLRESGTGSFFSSWVDDVAAIDASNGVGSEQPQLVEVIKGDVEFEAARYKYAAASNLQFGAELERTLPISILIVFKRVHSGDYQMLLSQGKSSSTHEGWSFFVSSSNELVTEIGDGSGGGSSARRTKVGTTLLGNNYNIVGAVIRGAVDMDLYINGVDDGGTYTGSGGAMTYVNHIGSFGGGFLDLGGEIAAVLFYDGDMVADGIKDDMESLLISSYGINTQTTVPFAFGTNDWSVTNRNSDSITITIEALPDDGRSSITDIEYQIDGGTWTSLGGTALGDYVVTGLTEGVEVNVAVRAINAIGAGAASTTKAVIPSTITILFDSDLDSDCDDAAAFALLSELARQGECVIGSFTIASENLYSAPTARILLDYTANAAGLEYLTTVPVGTYKGTDIESSDSVYTLETRDEFADDPADTSDNYTDAVTVLRQALADATDGSIKIVVAGTATNISDLLQSAADGISDLNGSELVAAKCISIHMMGGNFFNGSSENNIAYDTPAAIYLSENSPVPIYWAGYDVGDSIKTGIDSSHNTTVNPYRFIWNEFDLSGGLDANDERSSWDLCPVYHAVRGTASIFAESNLGNATFDPTTAETTFTEDVNGVSRYLTKTETDANIRTLWNGLIEDLMVASTP